ncbi:MAG: DUF4390 domain-containing protein [Gammaproteobacteria bacterium]
MPVFENNNLSGRTPYYDKPHKKAVLFLLWLFVPSLYIALPIRCLAESGIAVDHVELGLLDGRYTLSADIDYRLTATAKEALEKGIPLYWNLRFELIRKRTWLWDETVRTFEFRYRIQYQALLNRYQVSNIGNGERYSFATLSAALSKMTVIRKLSLFERDDVEPAGHYQIGIKIEFDREALPLPLRPISYFNPQWYLSSNWFLWPVQK